ncbi:MAG: vanadium-dependent haloperoxidase [Trueperaceae bacterium]|nr:vanadium-dependent haloperoxidase [Trueperaceae bacterium]
MSLQQGFIAFIITTVLTACPGLQPPAGPMVIYHPEASQSVARNWNEMLLQVIRNDFARPVVHARNLFQTSALMYDAWTVFADGDKPYLLGQTVDGFSCPFSGFEAQTSLEAARDEAISYAMYTFLQKRFENRPNINQGIDRFFLELGYDKRFLSTDYQSGSAAALGNYLADCMIRFAAQDGANELYGYTNNYYFPINRGLDASLPGNPNITDPNRWQPLIFKECFVDQSGQCIFSDGETQFVGAEWGNVRPFALSNADMTSYTRDDQSYKVYYDPGSPPHINPQAFDDSSEIYAWTMSTVARWSADLDPSNGKMIDISPGNIGNVGIENYPSSFEEFQQFYDAKTYKALGSGYPLNPYTQKPYEPNLVPLGDFTRVLAEFWADGPDSETPPGHWFVILNYVSDHPAFEKRFKGEGPVLDALEWDIKAYFTLGGAMHDAAIAAWSVKGWYDYIRPISAIRYMADHGQRSDPTLPNYSPAGLPLIPGFSELVKEGDALAGNNNENVGKLKIYAWRGPAAIANPVVDTAGVGWILAENWWPYQRPNFITPPFAGYVSGHSTFSRAAADIMTYLTGDAYFPGGLGEFDAPKNDFLVFEEGPSQAIVLQWATYQDASDQTSLSRIWGGIHPPADDIPGRIIGEKIANLVSEKVESYFKN